MTVIVNDIIISHTQNKAFSNCITLLSDRPGGEECFEVDRRSGEIKTTGRPLTPSKDYLLRVQVMDGRGHKGPPATVAILAGYRPPQFTNSSYSLNVPENTPVGQS